MQKVVQKYQFGFRNLIAWQEAHRLTLDIYRVTKSFPSEEKFGMISQLRRASSSVGANLAEGSSRKTRKDQNQFYMLAKSSLAEVDNFLELAHDLGYVSDKDYERLLNHLNKVAHLIYKLLNRKLSPSLPS